MCLLFSSKKSKETYDEALSHIRKVSFENNMQLKPDFILKDYDSG